MTTKTPEKIFRYPGLKPFAAYEQDIFFGRTKDIRGLAKLIQIQPQVVLYGKSGLGKSSLLNAAVIPLLQRNEEYLPIKVRMGAYQENQLLEGIISHLPPPQPENELAKVIGFESQSLWYHLKSSLIGKEQTVPILILDQFEEFFTYPKAQRQEVNEQLAGLLHQVIPGSVKASIEQHLETSPEFISDEFLRKIYQPLNVKIVFAIRSDKLSLLDTLKDSLPEILSKTFELEPLNRAQAEDAIVYPAYQKGSHFFTPRFDYSDEALDSILNFLTKSDEQSVESFQLQIICQHAEQLIHAGIKKGKKLIEKEDLGEISDIFENYYESLISRIPDEADRQKARIFIENGLILEGEEIRLSLHEGQISRDFDMPPNLLEQLINTRLIRRDVSPRGGYIYELSHDTLIDPILKAKEKRERQDRIDALQQARARDAEERERERRRVQRRTRIGIGILGVSLVALIAFGYLAMRLQEANDQLMDAQSIIVSRETSNAALVDTIENELMRKDSIIAEQEKLLIEARQALEKMDGNSPSDQRPPPPPILERERENEEESNTPVQSTDEIIDKLKQQEQSKSTSNPGRLSNIGKLQGYVGQLYNENEDIRRGAFANIQKYWNPDSDLLRYVIKYGTYQLKKGGSSYSKRGESDIGTESGIYHTLLLVDKFPDKILLNEKDSLRIFLKSVNEQYRSKETLARTNSIMKRIS